MGECTLGDNKMNCNCTYDPCPRKGLCCQCITFHRKSGELPACFFPPEVESTFDRSVERFIAMYQKRRR